MKEQTPDHSVENSADSKKLHDLLRQINRENGMNTSAGQPAQSSSIKDLLDNIKQNDRQAQLQQQRLDASQEAEEVDSLPGAFAPASTLLEQVMISTANPEQEVEEDLDFLAGVICDRIAPNLSLKMERKGFHRSNRIFSRETIETHRMSSMQFNPLPSPSENAKHNALELLTQEIEHLLYHRLILEQERQGRSTGCLPW
jgi:hypothetical protein